MGFDFLITLDCLTCPKTGRPMITRGADGEPMYDFSQVNVPEDQRRFLKMRGSHLHAQLQKVDPSISSLPAWNFAVNYIPTADAVFEQLKDQEYWSEEVWSREDDKAFREALDYQFSTVNEQAVTWSY